MRTETTTRTILSFEELTQEQQQKVIEDNYYLNVSDSAWYRWTYEEYDEILEALGFYNIELNFSGFSSQGDGGSFTAKFNHSYFDKKTLAGLIMEKSNILDSFIVSSITEIVKTCEDIEAQGPEYEGEWDLEHDFEVWRNNNNYYHHLSINANYNPMEELARHISQKFYQSLENEWNDLTSEEQIKETILSNEYEFYQDTLEIV